MLNLVAIFTTGGVLLFYKAFDSLKFDIIESLIQNQLLKEKNEQSYFQDPYRVMFQRSQDQSIVFMMAYQEHLQIDAPDQLLTKLRLKYEKKILPQAVVEDGIYKKIPAFDQQFERLLKKWQEFIISQKDQTKQQAFHETKMGKTILKQGGEKGKKMQEQIEKNKKSELSPQPINQQNGSGSKTQLSAQKQGRLQQPQEQKNSSGEDEEKEEEQVDMEPQVENQLNGEIVNVKTLPSPSKAENSTLTIEQQQEIAKRRIKELFGQNSHPKNPTKKEQIPDKQSNKKKKVLTVGEPGKVTQKEMDKLNKSKVEIFEIDDRKKNRVIYFGGENDKFENFINSDEESEEEEGDQFEQNGQRSQLSQAETQNTKKRGFFSKIINSYKTFSGTKNYDELDLQPILDKFKEQLMSKNVAEEIAQKLYDNVKGNLLDTKAQAFSSVQKIVKQSLYSALTKILTPKRVINPIAEAMRCKEQGKPYVITFIGVNGVGKSTNLAKVAYMFKNQGFSLMLAACDNFRAGAVEQIKTHGRCLDIPVFDKGYHSEPPEIAFQAIKEATLRKIDVVLIDTAGRMQDNEPLMRSLARLIQINSPDLILFIGEALVGNDGIDQLTKFNKALIDLSDKNNVREIDAIILSKFDTVDDKVGAAITMTYTTGKPILFVGVGQKYTHLKKLNVKTVVHALLS